MFFTVTKLIKVFDRFLFVFVRSFRLFVFLSRLIFCEWLLSDHLLVAIRFEQNVKITLEVETTFFRCRVHLRKLMRIYILIYIFVSGQMLLKHSQILFSLIDKTSHYFKHTWLTSISTVEVNEVFLFADVSIKFCWNTLSPEHVDDLVLHFLWNFSAQRKRFRFLTSST